MDQLLFQGDGQRECCPVSGGDTSYCHSVDLYCLLTLCDSARVQHHHKILFRMCFCVCVCAYVYSDCCCTLCSFWGIRNELLTFVVGLQVCLDFSRMTDDFDAKLATKDKTAIKKLDPLNLP